LSAQGRLLKAASPILCKTPEVKKGTSKIGIYGQEAGVPLNQANRLGRRQIFLGSHRNHDAAHLNRETHFEITMPQTGAQRERDSAKHKEWSTTRHVEERIAKHGL